MTKQTALVLNGSDTFSTQPGLFLLILVIFVQGSNATFLVWGKGACHLIPEKKTHLVFCQNCRITSPTGIQDIFLTNIFTRTAFRPHWNTL